MQLNQTFILDINNNVEYPDVFLCKRNHKIISIINNVKNLKIVANEKSGDEISFDVYKYVDDINCVVWNNLTDLKCVYVKGFGYFEVAISVNETINGEIIKTVTGSGQGENELSQVNATLEINTENDVAFIDNGNLTCFYNITDIEHSLLHRILTYAPHYSIGHVDTTLHNTIKEYTFDSDIMSIFDKLSTEIECLFQVDSENRIVNVYDLKDTCIDCGCRKVRDDVCTECGSTNIKYGYGDDTEIFVSTENLADNITLEGDKDSVKNCFKVKSADELMDSIFININPNGSNKIYMFPAWMQEDMSTELSAELDSYNTTYNNYKSEYEDLYNKILQCEVTISNYKYNMTPTLELISGYTCDQMMQAVMDKYNDNKIAVLNYSSISETSVQNNIKRRIKQMLEPGYELSFGDYIFNNITYVYSGTIKITDTVNSTEDNEVSKTETITVTIVNADADSEYQVYAMQEIEDALKKVNVNKVDTILTYLNEYSLSLLSNYSQALNDCLSVLIGLGCSNQSNNSDNATNIQKEQFKFYQTWCGYKEKIDTRIKELDNLVAAEARTKEGYETRRKIIKEKLNIQTFLGENLWKELYSFIREDTYENNNFSSEFSSAELKPDEMIERANELFELATEELEKASKVNYSLTASIHNLLVMKEFEPLKDKVALGNYIRIEVDGEVKRLKIISIEFDFENVDTINVTFSNVTDIKDATTALKSILEQTSSMATSFDSVAKKSEKGETSYTTFQRLKHEGLSAALYAIKNADEENFLIGQDGVTMKRGNEETGYDDRQLKIIHNMIAMTDDNWHSTRLCIGQGTYNGESRFGIWCDMLVGDLIVGKQLTIFNDKMTFVVDGDEVRITNGGLYIENNYSYTKIDNRDENVIEIGTIENTEQEVIEKVTECQYGINFPNAMSSTKYRLQTDGDTYLYGLTSINNDHNIYSLDTSSIENNWEIYDTIDTVRDFGTFINSDSTNKLYYTLKESSSGNIYRDLYEYDIASKTSTYLFSFLNYAEQFIANGYLYSYTTEYNSISSYDCTVYNLKDGTYKQSNLQSDFNLYQAPYKYNGEWYAVIYTTQNDSYYSYYVCKLKLSDSNIEFAENMIKIYDGNSLPLQHKTAFIIYKNRLHFFIFYTKSTVSGDIRSFYNHLIYDIDSNIVSTSNVNVDCDIWDENHSNEYPSIVMNVTNYGLHMFCSSSYDFTDKKHIIYTDTEKYIPSKKMFYVTNQGDLHMSGTLTSSHIIGGDINIGNGIFTVDEDGAVKINKGKLYITNGVTYTQINQDTENIIEVGKVSETNETSKVFYVTKDGKGYFNGEVTATALNLVGVKIDSSNITGLPTSLTDFADGKNVLHTDDLSISTTIDAKTGIKTTTTRFNGTQYITYTSSDGNYVITNVGLGVNNAENGNTYFKVSKEGLLEATNAIIHGRILANSGTIGGWIIEDSVLKNVDKTVILSGTATGTSTSISIGDNFKVLADGDITATKGTIAGWRISTTRIETDNIILNDDGTYLKGFRSGLHMTSDPDDIGSTAFFAGCLNKNGIVANQNNTNFYVTQGGRMYANDAVIGRALYLYDLDTDINYKIAAFKSDDDSETSVLKLGRVGKNEYNKVNCFVFNDTYDVSNITVNSGEFNLGSCKLFSSKGMNVDDAGGVFTDDYSIPLLLLKDKCLYLGTREEDSIKVTQTTIRGKKIYLNSDTNGGVYLGSSGSTVVTSDENLKEILQIDNKYMNFYNNLAPILYRYKENGHRSHVGFGARQVEQAILDAGLTTEDFAGLVIEKDVTVDENTHYDELYSLRYEEFVSLNTYMIKKLMERLEELEEKLKQVQN